MCNSELRHVCSLGDVGRRHALFGRYVAASAQTVAGREHQEPVSVMGRSPGRGPRVPAQRL